jgi:hypothetical protein
MLTDSALALSIKPQVFITIMFPSLSEALRVQPLFRLREVGPSGLHYHTHSLNTQE